MTIAMTINERKDTVAANTNTNTTTNTCTANEDELATSTNNNMKNDNDNDRHRFNGGKMEHIFEAVKTGTTGEKRYNDLVYINTYTCDEQPTNHLDLESIQSFNEGCQNFPRYRNDYFA